MPETLQADLASNPTKEDKQVHERALKALAHYYLHGDSTLLARIVQKLPNSNRRVAMLEWIRTFTVLTWDHKRESFIRPKIAEAPDLASAGNLPFWMLKIKKIQRRHTSGNFFDPDYYISNVIGDIEGNLEKMPPVKLQELAVQLLRIANKIQKSP